LARIRSIKPEFWTDEKVVSLTPLARLLFIGIWNFVDDYGRSEFSPARIKMQILPADPADIRQLLAEISGAGLVTIYAVDGKEYLQVSNFTKHQKIDARAKSKYPPPPISPDLSPEIPLEGKGKEGNGKDNAAVAASPDSEEIQFYKRGKQILGVTSGGLLRKLVTAKGANLPLARAALEQASQKENPREYIGAIIRGQGNSPEDLRARGEAW
jgi:hypothetical protein